MASDEHQSADHERPCWEINKRWPKFCASLSNGHGRCRKGTCYVLQARQSSLFDREHTDGF